MVHSNKHLVLEKKFIELQIYFSIFIHLPEGISVWVYIFLPTEAFKFFYTHFILKCFTPLISWWSILPFLPTKYSFLAPYYMFNFFIFFVLERMFFIYPLVIIPYVWFIILLLNKKLYWIICDYSWFSEFGLGEPSEVLWHAISWWVDHHIDDSRCIFHLKQHS